MPLVHASVQHNNVAQHRTHTAPAQAQPAQAAPEASGPRPMMPMPSIKVLVRRVWDTWAGVFTNERRLVLGLAMALISIQFGLMWFLKSKHDELTLAAIRDVLRGGYETVQNQVFEEQEALAAETRLMASDFGLRQAVATHDQPTIASMLENHQARSTRVRYDVQPWIGAVTTSSTEGTTLVNLMDLSMTRDAQGVQLVTYRHADILAPRPIASLRGTLALDDTFARRIAKLTGFQLIISGEGVGLPHRVLATSLSPDATKSAFAPLRATVPRIDAGTTSGPTLLHVSSAGPYSFVRVKALGSTVDGNVWLWIGKLDAQAVPALLDAAAVVQGWILLSLILSVITVSAVAYKLVRPISTSANTDVLTGLLNRRAYLSAAAAAIAYCRSHGQPIALLSMDLDKFKPINDTYGHAAGDYVLRVVGARLHSFFRSGDIVARLGGDEFCVLLKNVAPDQLAALTARVTAALKAPIERDGQLLVIGCSIGVMMSESAADLRLETLMDRADAALYAAKRARSGTVHWSPEIGSMHAAPKR